MKKTIDNSMDCKACRADLADLLLVEGYEAQRAGLAEHLSSCSGCAQELAELRATFALMDHWSAPEPSAYFDSKVRVGLREAEAAAPEGFWERMRSFVLFSTGRGLRPAMAGALALVMVAAGGGALMGTHPHPGVAPTSATVNDLRILDNNAQALQQMDQLLDDTSGDDGTTQPTT
jgi:anti-sigma factor RsiW